MSVSQNGWPVITSGSSRQLVNHTAITGKVRAGDVAKAFVWLAIQYSNRVESIRRDWSWGWANRPIRGSVATSNHASGTAEDYNAPRHPLGSDPSRTMSSKQRTECRKIAAESGGVFRWGGSYAGRKDTMHWEINCSAAALSAFVDKIEGRGNVKPTSPSKPKPVQPNKPQPKRDFPEVALAIDGKWLSGTSRAYQLMLRDAAGTYKGKIDGDFDELSVKAEQAWLAKLGLYKGKIDGKRLYKTKKALQTFLKRKGLWKIGKMPDNKALQRYINTQRKYIRR